jgi:SAM-dependent methyltransferase
VGYWQWHGEPGYWADVTRHFPADAAIVDLGCGTGWLGDHFARYTGVESSPDAVEAGRARGRNLVLADLQSPPLPFPDAAFDAAVLKDVLEHVRDPVAVVREVRRLVRPGGRVFASSPDAQRWAWDDYTHVRPFTRRGFALLFADHGFEVERVGYESVMPGIGRIAALTRRHRRPRLLNALARTRLVRRNVWLLARRAHEPSASA